ncbi:MAG TPA: 30S ribosomal protein S12 methylthiotransferase RimO [Nitrospirota bacterium]|nr:30S ribosomal protein S12 methylthiotransferase RimO [Nitrospirota bacterium]
MKVGMVSLGCPKNQVDAEVMAGLIRQAGHKVTDREAEAEAIIVNTCAFIQDATEESIEAILEIAELKEHGKLRYLITTGCLAQKYKDGLVRELPEVDAYLGTGEVEKIAAVLAALSKGKYSAKHEIPEPDYIYGHETPRVRFSPSHWGYLKVADGCDNRCTYCVIPMLRGRLRSRTAASIFQEAQSLAANGVKELCIIAQDITAYGADRKGAASLAGLLKRLEKVKGLAWIRLLYTHPAHFTDELVGLLASSGKVLPYLDIPIQHIDEDVLGRMGRKTKPDDIRRLLGTLRDRIPGLALRTSLMVGFPGETKDAFMGLLRFVKEFEFDHLGVFTYSEEEGTPAAAMPRKVSEELADERRGRIMKAQAKVSLRKNRARVGKTYRVLVDGPSSESDLLISGRAYFQAPEIDGVIYITDGEAKAGEFADVTITEAHEYDLVGYAKRISSN